MKNGKETDKKKSIHQKFDNLFWEIVGCPAMMGLKGGVFPKNPKINDFVKF